MEIKEAQEKLELLRWQIQNLVNAFKEETGLLVVGEIKTKYGDYGNIKPCALVWIEAKL